MISKLLAVPSLGLAAILLGMIVVLLWFVFSGKKRYTETERYHTIHNLVLVLKTKLVYDPDLVNCDVWIREVHERRVRDGRNSRVELDDSDYLLIVTNATKPLEDN